MLRIALIAILLTLPGAAATWGAYGEQEPNSVYDDPHLMWTDPPHDDASRVYFDAYQTLLETANPNLGSVGSRVRAEPDRSWNAMLAEWTDCNDDGFVGMAETAIIEYRSALLDADGLARCPDGTSHNAGGWVTEARAIGAPDGAGPIWDRDPRVIIDDDAWIWGDAGTPGAPRSNEGAVGGLVVQRDARAQHLSAGSWHTAAGGDPSAPWQACLQEGSPIAIAPRGMPTGINRDAVHVVGYCGEFDNTLDTTYGLLAVNMGIEDWNLKTRADAVFSFSAQSRGSPVPATDPLLGTGDTPTDLGVSALAYWDPVGELPTSDAPSGHGSMWHADVADASGLGLLGRGSTVPPPEHWTFYAHVGRGTLASGLIPSGTGFSTYGFPACQTIGAGAPNMGGWDCDPAQWYSTPWGPEATPHHYGRLGDPYHLRDVDCLDGAIFALNGVAAGYPAWLDEPNCDNEKAS